MWDFFLGLLGKRSNKFDLIREDLVFEEKPFPINIIIDQPYDEEKVDFLASAHNVWHESSFQDVIKYLSDCQVKHAVTEAPSWDRVIFDRATINGFNLVVEEFERLEAKYQDLHRQTEDFNKHDII